MKAATTSLTHPPVQYKTSSVGKMALDRKKMKNKRLKDHIGKDGKLKFRDCKVLFIISSPPHRMGFINVCFASSPIHKCIGLLEGFFHWMCDVEKWCDFWVLMEINLLHMIENVFSVLALGDVYYFHFYLSDYQKAVRISCHPFFISMRLCDELEKVARISKLIWKFFFLIA